ncbi:MAG: alkaline phosphatase D family protein [Hyphomicrobium sp.]|nr:alkaline phosphatase D family protein [Hyphomicrobium sp.]
MAAAAAALAKPSGVLAADGAGLPKDPFAMLGVASGDPTPDGIVIWCRLVLDLEDGARWGLPELAYAVRWELRDLEADGRPVAASGTAIAASDNGYAVHVEVNGLKPATRYAYRFMLGDHGADGVTLTAPARDAPIEKLRFAFCSCAEYELAWPYAYEFMARDEPAFIVHLGDYIYETTYDQYFRSDLEQRAPRDGCESVIGGRKRVRFLKYDRTQKVETLAQFRRRYGEYKRDPRLKSAHQRVPFIVTWDDHEVENDYAGPFSEVREAQDFLERRTNAYRAYFENLPIRLSVLPVSSNRRQLFRGFDFGTLLRLNMLDERQYRSDQACQSPLRGGGRAVALSECAEIEAMIGADGAMRDMLGEAQSLWLARQLETSTATWNVLAQGVMMAAIDSRRDCNFDKPKTEPYVWTDGWGGYAAARQRMVELLDAHRAKNPLVLSGDVHSHFVTRVLADWKDQSSGSVAPEFVCTAISSNLRNYEPWMGPGSGNERTIVDIDCRHHGYTLCDVTPEHFDVTAMKVVPDAFMPKIEDVRAEKSFTYRVTAGDPEPRKIS